MNTVPGQTDPDFSNGIPEGPQFFSVTSLAKLWDCDPKHVHELIDSGEIKLSFSLHGKGATKSMRRVPRAAVLDFLHRRKNQ